MRWADRSAIRRRRIVDRTHGPYTRRPRGDPVRRRRTENGRSRRPGIRTAGSRGTLSRQIAGALRRLAATRRVHGRSRNGPARCRTGWSMWDRAGRMRSMAAPRAAQRRSPCQHTRPRQSGVDRAIASARWRPLTTVVVTVFRSSRVSATSRPFFRRECSIHHSDASGNCRCRPRSAAVSQAGAGSFVINRSWETNSVLTAAPAAGIDLREHALGLRDTTRRAKPYDSGSR